MPRLQPGSPIAICAALAAAACGNGSSGAPPSGLSIRQEGSGVLRADPGQRNVVLARLRVQATASPVVVSGLAVQVEPTRGSRAPFERLRLVLDRDGDGGLSGPDEVLATLRDRDGGRTASTPLRRDLAASASERWLVVADVRLAAIGIEATLRIAAADVAVEGARGRRLAASVTGGAVVRPILVRAAPMAAAFVLRAGGARAAVRVPENVRPARLVVSGNAATDLRDEGDSVFSFLLPPLPPGRVDVVGLDAAGRLLFARNGIATCCAGSGPARFVDRSLERLPYDHAFSQDAEVADVDLDSDPDLVIPSYAGQRDRLYLNDGTGRFEDATSTHMPDVRVDSVHLEPVDVDGDGDVDLAVAVEGDRNRLYVNDGGGRFRDATQGRLPADRDYTEDLRAGDVDGDGDLDLVAANLVDPDDSRRGGQLRVYLNDGHGVFTDATSRAVPVRATRTYDVNLADLDGDGDLDLLGAGYGDQDLLYENNGRGVFVDRSASLPRNRAFHTSAAVGDVDGDGDLDAVLGTFVGQSRLYRNDGALRFADATPHLPQIETSTYDVAFGDLDGDGDLDLVLANTENPSIVARNDGAGRFAPLPRQEFPTPDDNAYDVQLVDVDLDGALDVLITAWGDRHDTLYVARSTRPPAGAPRLLRIEPNWGPPRGGNWVTVRGTGFVAGTTVSIGGRPLAEAKITRSGTILGRVPSGRAGLVEAVVRTPDGKEQRVPAAYSYEPPPPGAFEDVTDRTLGSDPASSTSVDTGDLDGDGLPDLVFADQKNGARVFLNRRGRPFVRVPFGPLAASPNDVLLAELTGDGKLDLVLADAGARPWLLRGTGGGRFASPRRLPAPADGAEDVGAGDLDGDGDLDLVFATGAEEAVLRNDGKGGFTVVAQPKPAIDPSRGLALGDLDGDGDLDLLVANFMQASRLYANDGKGVFTPVTGALPRHDGDQSYAVALADVDGDGDLDAAIANGGAQVNRLLLNDGRGRFTDASSGVFKAALGGGAYVVFGDVDRDGDPDLLSAHFWGSNHLYLNDGGNLAERRGMLPTTPGGFPAAAFADLDADGDLDIVFAAFWGGSRVLRNPHVK